MLLPAMLCTLVITQSGYLLSTFLYVLLLTNSYPGYSQAVYYAAGGAPPALCLQPTFSA